MATRNALKTNYVIKDGTLWEDFTTANGWAAGANGTLEIDTSIYKTGTSSGKFTVNAGSASEIIEKTISLVFDGKTNFTYWVYIPDVDKLGANGIVFYLASVANFSKVFSKGFGKTALHSGWNKLTIARSEMSATGGEVWTNTMVRARFRVYADGTNACVVYFDSIYYDFYSKPKVLITFDDGWDSQYTKAYAYMQPLGLKGTVCVIGADIDTPDNLTKAQLTTMNGAGWDLATHGGTLLTTLETQAEMEAEILLNKDYLDTNGFTRASDHYAYPGGAYNDTALAALGSLGFKTARTIIDRTQGNYIDEKYLLTRQAILNSTSVAVAQGYIDNCIARGTAILLNFHIIVDADADTTTKVLTSTFNSIVDYIKTKQQQGLLDVVTISEWYNGLDGRRNTATSRTSATNRTGLKTNYEIQAGTLLEGFESLGDWTASPASPGTLALSTDSYQGTYSLAVTSATSANNKQAIRTINKSFADAGYVFTFFVKPDDYTDTIVLGFSSATSFASVYMNYAINTTTMQKNKWNMIRVAKSDFTAVGGESWSNTMIRMRVRNVSSSGTLPSTALFDDLRYGRVYKPKVILMSDNVGSLSTIQKMYPILDAAGLKGTLYIQSNLVGQANKLSLANLQTLYNAGWDLGNHTNAHENLTEVSIEEAQATVETCEQFLSNNGFLRGLGHIAYPEGATNAAVNSMLESIGFKTGRKATDRPQIVPPADFFTMDAYTIKAADALATVTGYVDTCIAKGNTCALMIEGLADTDPAEQEWLTSNYQSLIDHIVLRKNQGVIEDMTISEWYNGLDGRRKEIT